MGGLMDGHYGKEAWVGRKPNHNWTGLEAPDAINFPQPSQMRSSDTKAGARGLRVDCASFAAFQTWQINIVAIDLYL